MNDSKHNPTSEITLDFQRPQRIGLSEAVYCLHKSVAQLCAITEQVISADTSMLYTRLAPTMFAMLEQKFPQRLDYEPVSQTAIFRSSKTAKMFDTAQVAVVTGGSSDVPIAREATRTLNFFHHPVLEINDVGVAGLWRLQKRLDEIKTKKIVICVAGMDAALPTVLGGLIPSVIIAVPSSVGYGMAKNGETALQALLCSCAPGLVVVNIDNGYGAACAALRYLNNST
jgi:pyridinium-3,5-biscarboxylic acid mononucleotide synthase